MEEVEAGGRRRYRPSEREASWSDVPYLARYTAERMVRRPRGYLLASPDPDVLDVLLAHGIAVERLIEPATVEVQAFEVTGISASRRPNQGHFTSSVEGRYATVEREFAAGSLWISNAQALGHLATSLLEPESDDGLVFWNFFDRYLAAQWSRAPQTYPVFKLHTAANLVTEPVQ